MSHTAKILGLTSLFGARLEWIGLAGEPVRARLNLQKHLLTVGFAIQLLSAHGSDSGFDGRGRQFLYFDSFSSFAQTSNADDRETILDSPKLQSRMPFNEVVVSWNAETPRDSYLLLEVRAIYGTSTTRYYSLGLWSTDASRHPRASVPGQKDHDGEVATDTLLLEHAAECLQVRLRLGGDGAARPTVRFLGISLTDTNVVLANLPAERDAWDKLLAVPERTQMIYPNGKTLCSPTTVSMLMAYWAETLKRPELDRTVPQIADAIYDAQWHGTGNWAFNMAYAGSFPGMRAYVARLSDVRELEEWVSQDIPVGLSVDYDRLRAKGSGPNGHLVVCVGFTKTGDPVINDPGTSQHVRKIFSRQNLVSAWACSRNTVYFVYPQSAHIPPDRFRHWESQATRFPDALAR